MVKIALINNFDDVDGGPDRRTNRFRQVLPGLAVFGRDSLSSTRMQRELAADYDGFILSGSPHNVTDIHRPEERWMMYQEQFIRNCQKPVLGVCFGHQLICHAFGATVRKIQAVRRKNASARITLLSPCVLVPDLNPGSVLAVEQTHQQEVESQSLPPQLVNIAVPEANWARTHATAKESRIQMVRHKSRPVFGTQFHPETWPGASSAQAKTGAMLLKGFETLCRFALRH